jgi:ketosteroid isomerase-like protein
MAELPIEDRIAIGDLVTEYAWLLDHRRWHEVADLCTEDAVLVIRGREIRGRSGLAAWAEHRAANQARRTQHQMTLVRLEPTSDPDLLTGTAALVLHVAKAGHGGTYVDLVGEYRDEYLRTPPGWRFRRRHLVRIEDF